MRYQFASCVLTLAAVAGTALADDSHVALHYNFNGMVHPTESELPDSMGPSGFRSIADRGLVIDGTSTGQVAFGALPIVGATGVTYDIVRDPFTLDIVMLGNRNLNAAWEATAPGTSANRGIRPDWLANDDQRTPQTTTLSTPIALDAYAEIGLLYHISNGGGSFTVTLGFTDNDPVTFTVFGPDWFGPRPALPPASGSGLSTQAQLGVFKGANNTDRGTPSTDAGQRLNVWEAVIDVRRVLQAGIADLNGKHLSTITYTYPDPVPTGNRDIAIFATSVRTGSAPAPNSTCATAITVGTGTTAGNNTRAISSAPSSCGIDDDAAVWYRYDATSNRTIEARTCGSAVDTTMVVYSGCDGAEVACNDNYCSTGSRVSWQGVPGQAYMIRIAANNHVNGNFVLSIDDPVPTYQPVALNYNFNGITHGLTEQGQANVDNPNGYRSIGDRGLLMLALSDNEIDATPVVDVDGMPFSLVSEAGALDLVHLGNRNLVGNAIRAYGTGGDNAPQPTWQTDPDQTGPQTTALTPGYTFGAATRVGVLYHIAENGGHFNMTLNFNDSTSAVLTLTAPDWFNSQVPPAPGATSGLTAQRQLGVYASTEGTDYADFSENGLNVVEAVTTVSELSTDGFGNFAGKTLSSIVFSDPISNANYPNSTPATAAGFAIFAVTLREVTPGAPACPADIGGTGGVAGADGNLDNNDFIVYIDNFFNHLASADIGVTGGVAGSDGAWDNNDFIVFIDQFFAGCGG